MRIDYIGMKGTTTGKADIYLDGVKKATVDLAADPAVYQVKLWSSGWIKYGTHHLKHRAEQPQRRRQVRQPRRGRHLGDFDHRALGTPARRPALLPAQGVTQAHHPLRGRAGSRPGLL